jgi:hypothetical protein
MWNLDVNFKLTVDQEVIKVSKLQLLLGLGGLWHVVGVDQKVDQEGCLVLYLEADDEQVILWEL